MSRRFLLFVLSCAIAAVAFPGCGSRPEVVEAPIGPDRGSAMAHDAAEQLKSLYPAVHTRFAIESSGDRFGATLSEALRAHGYGVLDIYPGQSGTPGVTVSYIISAQGLEYKVVLYVGRDILSRMYLLNDNGDLEPLGAWVKREL